MSALDLDFCYFPPMLVSGEMADSGAGAGNRQDEPEEPHSAGKGACLPLPPRSDNGVTKGQRTQLKELLMANARTI